MKQESDATQPPQGAPLSVNGDVLPVVRALEQTQFYGTVTIIFEEGRPKEIAILQRMRARIQARRAVKRLVGE